MCGREGKLTMLDLLSAAPLSPDSRGLGCHDDI